MTAYRVVFHVPAEVVVTLDAEDDDVAADVAWELAQQHLSSTAMLAPATGVAVLMDLDGIGADEVDETGPVEGCPDCGQDSIAIGEGGTSYCTRARCGWRE